MLNLVSKEKYLSGLLGLVSLVALSSSSVACVEFPFLDHDLETEKSNSGSKDSSELNSPSREKPQGSQVGTRNESENSADSRESVPPSTVEPANDRVTTHCRLQFSRVGLCAEVVWEKGFGIPNQPPIDESTESVFVLKFYNSQGQPQDLRELRFTLAVRLFMPSMGHGSSPVKLEAIRGPNGEMVPGQFRVSSVYFIMPGDWEIQFKLKRNANELVDEDRISLEI